MRKLYASKAAGVTLTEMLVVIAIASILLAVVFPAVGSGLRTLELRSAATRLAIAARYARDQAVHRQRTFQLAVDSGRRVVEIGDVDGSTPRRYELPESVRIARVLPAAQTEESLQRFLFLPDGAAPEFRIVLANDRRELAVVGDALTGTARVEE